MNPTHIHLSVVRFAALLGTTTPVALAVDKDTTNPSSLITSYTYARLGIVFK